MGYNKSNALTQGKTLYKKEIVSSVNLLYKHKPSVSERWRYSQKITMSEHNLITVLSDPDFLW